MERWALVSGLQGDLDLYEQIQKELKQQRGVANLFVLGDLIGSQRKCNALLDRLRQPKRADLQPDCIYGWWEEQLLAECGYRGERKAEGLRAEQGEAAVTARTAAVLGMEFSAEALAAVCGGGAARVDRHLRQLTAAGLLVRRGRRYRFAYRLLHRTAWQMLTRRARTRLRRRLAAARGRAR